MEVAFVLIVIAWVFGFTCGAVKTDNKTNSLEKQLDNTRRANYHLQEDNKTLKAENRELKKTNNYLSKYQDIVDAKAEAKAIREKSKAMQEKAEEKLNDLSLFYNETIHRAEKKAQEIISTAEHNLKEQLQVMQISKLAFQGLNDYEGYLVPYTSFFEELGTVYGFKEAGRQLKLAQNNSSDLYAQNRAISSNLHDSEASRMLVSLLIDYFNTVADNCILRYKTEKLSHLIAKLESVARRINITCTVLVKDADIRITPAYLDSKINELRWAVKTLELDQQRKDQQRALKEQARDAAKAKKEQEKAILKNKKEIDKLKEERDKLIEIMKSLSDQLEKEKYFAEISAKDDAIQILQEDNVKRFTRAQTGTYGFVYIVSNVGSYGENVFKIGLTRRDKDHYMERIDELFSPGVPFPFDVHAVIESENAPQLEKQLHNIFALDKMNKVRPYKEFFRTSCHKIREQVEKLGLDVTWTLDAEAKEYKESLRIDHDIQSNEEIRNKYLDILQENIYDIEQEDEDDA